MSLFGKTIDRRNRIINRYANRFVRRIRWELFKTSWKGELSTEMSLRNADIYEVPSGLTGEGYKRTAEILNNIYKGEVNAEVLLYAKNNYRGIKVTIVKV